MSWGSWCGFMVHKTRGGKIHWFMWFLYVEHTVLVISLSWQYIDTYLWPYECCCGNGSPIKILLEGVILCVHTARMRASWSNDCKYKARVQIRGYSHQRLYSSIAFFCRDSDVMEEKKGDMEVIGWHRMTALFWHWLRLLSSSAFTY